MDTLPLHPALVHLPIALGVIMPVVAGGLALAWWRGWLPARGWLIAVALQAALVATGVAALRTGGAEEERVERVVPEAAIEAHEEAAEGFVMGGGAVLAVMIAAAALGRRRVGVAVAGVAALGTVAVLGLGYQAGHAGGELVYRHGAASAYGAPAGPLGAVPAPTGGDRDGDNDGD